MTLFLILLAVAVVLTFLIVWGIDGRKVVAGYWAFGLATLGGAVALLVELLL